MMTDDAPARIHVHVLSPWRNGVIDLLTRAELPTVAGGQDGDGVLLVVGSEPPLVLTTVGRVGEPYSWYGVAEVSEIDAALGWSLPSAGTIEGDRVPTLADALGSRRPVPACGPTSMAAANALLDSHGHCTGCGSQLDLAGDRFAIRTADAPDWPAVLCDDCQSAMRSGSFTSFVEFMFARHPQCPSCDGRRTQRGLFGLLPSYVQPRPWEDVRGCCLTPDIWTCSLCGHQW